MPKLLQILVAIPLIIILIPLALLVVATWLLHGLALNVLVWLCWCSRGKHLLLVYSDSPHWHDYIEDNIIPRLPNSTVVLNWSQRRTWHWYSLPVMAFRHFGGTREFNPMVVAFRPFRRTKTFRFWQPFKDYKHGKPQALEELERTMLTFLADNELGTAT
jgi:hypothetical protein